MPGRDILPQTIRARELYGDYWFNSEPVPVAALRGSVILIHFWDFTCAASVHSLVYIKEWYKRYAGQGLTVVGVHTPRFPFGRNPEVVQRALHRLDVRHPVVMDNEALIASQYGMRSLPSFYAIDKDGFIRFEAVGQGDYQSMEHVLQTLLYGAGAVGELPLLMDPVRAADRSGALCYKATPELFAGYVRGTMGNVEGYSPESVVPYTDPEIYLEDRIYADGNWVNEKDSLRLDAPEGEKGRIMVHYQGLEANGVFGPGHARSLEVSVQQDEQYLSRECRGKDIRVAANGRSFIVVEEPRLYNLVRNARFGEHLLRLTIETSDFTLYSLAFDTAIIPELVPNS